MARTRIGVDVGSTAVRVAEVAATSTLQLQVTVEFYTTDLSAGPGSIPGPTQSTTGA